MYSPHLKALAEGAKQCSHSYGSGKPHLKVLANGMTPGVYARILESEVFKLASLLQYLDTHNVSAINWQNVRETAQRAKATIGKVEHQADDDIMAKLFGLRRPSEINIERQLQAMLKQLDGYDLDADTPENKRQAAVKEHLRKALSFERMA